MLSSLLLSAGQQRPLWREVGVGLVAVDTLVHNFLLRTGILRRLGADHPYGVRCYRTGGCADILTRFAASIDARQFNPALPEPFHALCRMRSGATAPQMAWTSATAIASTILPGATIDTVRCLDTAIASLCAPNAGKSHEFHDLKLLTERARFGKEHASRHESRDPVAAPSFGEQ